MKNKVGREISDKILDSTNYKPFETTEIGHPIVHYTGHDVRVTKGDDKLVDSLDDVIKNNLKDGMTISTTTSVMVTLYLTWLWIKSSRWVTKT